LGKNAYYLETRMNTGAGNGNRTRTAFQPRDFKSLVSTNFTIPAPLCILRKH
jgi:hypothetical protein